MAVGRLVLAGLAAAGAYGVWRRRQPGAAGGGITRAVGPAAGAAAGGGGAGAPSTAAAATESATTMPDQSGPLPAEPTGGLDAGGTGAGVEGTAAPHTSGTRSDDPLTGVTGTASELPEPTASPDGTPAAGPVETRRVVDDRD